MASAIYPDFLESCLGGGVHRTTDLVADAILVGLVDTGTDYTYGAAHADWADVYNADGTGYNTVSNEVLTNKTDTVGVFDCTDDITFTAVAIDGTKTVDAIVHYANTGTNQADDPLICYHDAFGAVTPNGGDIIIQYNGSGIFAL